MAQFFGQRFFYVYDWSITQLCDTICVDGKLNLSWCVNLDRLPTRIVIRVHLVTTNCPKVWRFREIVYGPFGFTTSDCSNLESIEPPGQGRGMVDLRGCIALDALLSNFTAVDLIELDGLRIAHCFGIHQTASPRHCYNGLHREEDQRRRQRSCFG